MYSREGGSPARGPQRKPLVPCPWERGRGAGPGAGGIANMPHVQFSVTDAYDAGIRRIDRQSHRGVDLRYARRETSSSETYKRHRHRRKGPAAGFSPDGWCEHRPPWLGGYVPTADDVADYYSLPVRACLLPLVGCPGCLAKTAVSSPT